MVKLKELTFPHLSPGILHYSGSALPKPLVLGFLLAMGFVCTVLFPNEMYLYSESLPVHGSCPIPLKDLLP